MSFDKGMHRHFDHRKYSHLKTRADWESYLKTDLPPLIGRPDGCEELIGTLLDAMRRCWLFGNAPSVLVKFWGKRCQPQMENEIFDAYEDLERRDKEKSELNHQELQKKKIQWEKEARAREQKRREAERLRQRDIARRQKSGELNRALAAELNVSTRQAYSLRKEGTTNIETARIVAKFCGGGTDKYLRARRTRSQKRSVLDRFMGIEFENCSFESFVDSGETTGFEYGERALVLNLKEIRHKGIGLHAIKTIQDLYDYLRWVEAKHRKQYVRIPYLWAWYQEWRLNRLHEEIMFQIGDSMVFHPNG